MGGGKCRATNTHPQPEPPWPLPLLQGSPGAAGEHQPPRGTLSVFVLEPRTSSEAQLGLFQTLWPWTRNFPEPQRL